MTLHICFAYTFPSGSYITEAKITQRVFFKLISDKLRPLDDFTEVAYRINNLMCFAIDATVSLKKISATSIEKQKDLNNGILLPIPIYIYYPSIPFDPKVPNKNGYKMLFRFAIIKPNAQNIFNNWINAYDTIAPALNLYFSTKNGGQKYLDGKFLALVQGLETYHRRTSDEKMMDSNEFELLVSTIIDSCPDDYQEWLRGRLTHGNEINLRKRLKLIIDPFKHLFGSKDKRNRLLNKIVDTRNYLTHYDEKSKINTENNNELYIISQTMEIIFQLHLLKVIGFNSDEINDIVNNCSELKQKIAYI